MKLHSQKEHHVLKGTVWVPKLAFENTDEIKEKLGFLPKPCRIYKCTICNFLHTTCYPKDK